MHQPLLRQFAALAWTLVLALPFGIRHAQAEGEIVGTFTKEDPEEESGIPQASSGEGVPGGEWNESGSTSGGDAGITSGEPGGASSMPAHPSSAFVPSSPAVCGKPSAMNPSSSENRLGFPSFASGPLGTCWANILLERALRSGATFGAGSAAQAGAKDSGGSITQKLDALLKGQPQNFSDSSSIRDFSNKHQGELRQYLATLQKKKFYNIGNLGFALGGVSSAKNKSAISGAQSLVQQGTQPLVVIKQHLTRQHVLNVIGANGSSLTVLDPSRPNQGPQTIQCDGSGNCQYPGYGNVGVHLLKDRDLATATKMASQRACTPGQQSNPRKSGDQISFCIPRENGEKS